MPQNSSKKCIVKICESKLVSEWRKNNGGRLKKQRLTELWLSITKITKISIYIETFTTQL